MQLIKPGVTGNIYISLDSQPGFHYATGPPDRGAFKLAEKVYQ